jgi:hypothetical protein
MSYISLSRIKKDKGKTSALSDRGDWDVKKILIKTIKFGRPSVVYSKFFFFFWGGGNWKRVETRLRYQFKSLRLDNCSYTLITKHMRNSKVYWPTSKDNSKTVLICYLTCANWREDIFHIFFMLGSLKNELDRRISQVKKGNWQIINKNLQLRMRYWNQNWT